ncbi:MAG: DUF5071 domain-containing protein [Bacteroidaceae bacterium]|nr:DUF5071 domain-containing protein [Bacteroidaceae bacterium]
MENNSMHIIDRFFSDLSWDADPKRQEEAINEAANIKVLSIFIQPLEGKEYWDNCAVIISRREDKELEKYIYALLEWLKDMNWPGADTIYQRLCRMNKNQLIKWIKTAKDAAITTGDLVWLQVLNDLLDDVLRIDDGS